MKRHAGPNPFNPFIYGIPMGLSAYVFSLYLFPQIGIEWPYKPRNLILFALVPVLIGYAFRLLLEWINDSRLNSRLYGFGRQESPVELKRMEFEKQIAYYERACEYEFAIAKRDEYIKSGIARDPAGEAYAIAQIYEEHLKSPVDALQWYRRTLTYGDSGDGYRPAAEEGVIRLRDSVKCSEADRRLREETIKDAIAKEDFNWAEALCGELARLYPHNGNHLFLLGIIATRKQNHVLAAMYYRQALDRNGKDAKAAFNLAVALTKAYQDVEARNAWRYYLLHFSKGEPKYTEEAMEALAKIENRLKPNIDLAVK